MKELGRHVARLLEAGLLGETLVATFIGCRIQPLEFRRPGDLTHEVSHELDEAEVRRRVPRVASKVVDLAGQPATLEHPNLPDAVSMLTCRASLPQRFSFLLPMCMIVAWEGGLLGLPSSASCGLARMLRVTAN